MNCPDAREGFSALFRGGMGLTELALLDAHVRQCVDCRKELDYLQHLVSSGQRVAPQRALLLCFSKMRAAIHFGTTRFAAWLTQLRILLAISLAVTGQVAARVIEASRVGAVWLDGLLTRVRWLRLELLAVTGQVAARVIAASRVGAVWLDGLLTRVRWLRLELFKLSIRASASATPAVGLAITHAVELLARLRSSLMVALKWTARAALRSGPPVP